LELVYMWSIFVLYLQGKYMQTDTISQRAIDKCLSNNRVIGRLMAHFDRHYETIRRWIKTGDEALNTPVPLQIIREETGFTDEEILDREVTGATK
jgi:hypothetical protein